MELNHDYYEQICNLDRYEILSGRSYQFIAQVFVSPISTEIRYFEDQVKLLFEHYRIAYKWSECLFKVMPPNSSRSTIGFITCRINS